MEFKNKEARHQPQQYEMVGRPPTGKKPKNKNIKVTDDVHRQLGEIGRLTEDYGDVVERLLKFYNENHQGKWLLLQEDYGKGYELRMAQ